TAAHSSQTACASPASRTSPRRSLPPPTLPTFPTSTWIIATKATQLEEAATALAGRFPGATMMTIQNGLRAEELVREHGAWRLLSAVTFMSGVRHGDAHVEYELDTETWLGPFADTATYE